MIIDLNKNKQLITKQAILQHIQDIDIYRKYLNQEINLKQPMLSPLMKDNKPSLGFFIGENNEICFNDFRIGKGDAIRFVQLLEGISYFDALSKIAVDFNLDKDYICKNITKSDIKSNTNNYLSREEILSKVGSLYLNKKKRDWQIHDIVYWSDYGISIETLKFYNVEPLDYIFINDKIIKADKHCYCFTEYKDNKETYKIYQPFNIKYKWLNSHNDSVWQGWEQLPNKGDDLIITKSLKDVMALYEVTGYSAVSLQSEGILPKHHVFSQLDERFQTIYSLYDNDFDKDENWGKIFGDKIAREFGLIESYIPDKYKCKDFSDLVKQYGKDKAKYILNSNVLLPF